MKEGHKNKSSVKVVMKYEARIKALAKESLDTFQSIVTKAEVTLEKRALSAGSDPQVINMNTMVDGGVIIKNSVDRTDIIEEGYNRLIQSPAVSRVLVSDIDDQNHIYYITKGSTIEVSNDVKLVSRDHPIGRLASLDIGDEEDVELPNGESKNFTVIESSQYTPVKEKYWDSKPSHFKLETGSYTVASLLELLKGSEFDEDDIAAYLDALDRGEIEESQILKGRFHQVLESMSLREQPILDKFQDEIFRLPINSQVLIIGPPGTGKTTTLIRRLGQKLTEDALSQSENRIVAGGGSSFEIHQQSWLMFTPTELLKHFVKEAFNRERVSVSATDEKVKTWEVYRMKLAREALGLLQTTTSKGKFVFQDKFRFLNNDIRLDPLSWYEEFLDFHKERIFFQMQQGLSLLKDIEDPASSELVLRLEGVLTKFDSNGLLSLFSEIYQFETLIEERTKQLKAESGEAIRKSLTLILNTEGKGFIDELVEYLTSLEDVKETEEEAAESEFDIDLDDTLEQSSIGVTKQQAIRAYEGSIRSLARNKYKKKSLAKNSRVRKIKEWLGARIISDEQLNEIGRVIVLQNGFRRFIKIYKRYVTDVPSSYKAFRQDSIKRKTGLYENRPKENRHIDATELDAVVLLSLKSARELLIQRFVEKDINLPKFDFLSIVKNQFKNQILVDEAMDFSPLQLAAMESLTALETKSFFACGDFNQRITDVGVRSVDQINWVSKAIDTRTVNVVYRQCSQLNQFSEKLLRQFNGDISSKGELPKDLIFDGFPPAIQENLQEYDDVAIWLMERLQEVEVISGIGRMPTVAVLVANEEDVKPTTSALNELLGEISLRAVACFEGQSLGEESDVRVFDVQHIKGLEFEAVFFIDIDVLAENSPNLFDKYLYVGSTRAATFLGITSRNRMPQQLEPLRESFLSTWEIVSNEQ